MQGEMITAASGILGQGLGMATANWQDKRQIKQQEKLQKMQIQGQKEMGEFNKEQAMDVWNKTNYAAQRKQMEKAGLNVGLMYKGAGEGGTTQGATPGSVTGGQAAGATGEWGMGMQMGMQAAQAAAMLEQTKAQTENIKADTARKTGVETEEIESKIGKLIAETTNEKLKGNIMEYEKQIKEVEASIAEKTEWDAIKNIAYANEKLIGEMRSAQAQGQIDQSTADTKIKQIEQNSVEQSLRIATQKAGLIKTGAETNAVNKSIEKMASEIVMMNETQRKQWREWEQAEKERWIKEQLMKNTIRETDFNTSTPEQIKQWTGVIGEVVKAISSIATGKPNKIGF